MEIKLTKGYFITVDDWQYILSQRYTYKTEKGEDKTGTRNTTYHRTLGDAIERYLKCLQDSVEPCKVLSLREYCKLVEKSNKEAVKDVKDLVGGRAV